MSAADTAAAKRKARAEREAARLSLFQWDRRLKDQPLGAPHWHIHLHTRRCTLASGAALCFLCFCSTPLCAHGVLCGKFRFPALSR